jgi:hypothetical protein
MEADSMETDAVVDLIKRYLFLNSGPTSILANRYTHGHISLYLDEQVFRHEEDQRSGQQVKRKRPGKLSTSKQLYPISTCSCLL